MARTKVKQGNVPQLMAELGAKGATNVRRTPAGLDGRVVVTWEEPGEAPMTDEEYRQNMLAYTPVYILSALLAALLVGVMVVLSVL